MLHDPFNTDEREAQARAGGGPLTAPIRDRMPEQHQLFFAALPAIAAATVEADGWPTATLLTGPPGFVAALDPVTLRIAAQDPAFGTGQPIGLLGIDFATRRRNRANGDIIAVTSGNFEVRVRESFGNCPKYIQRRTVEPMVRAAELTETLSALDATARSLIEAADTMFIASRARAGLGGVDMSHRGGRPGFVLVEGDRLTVRDFAGNRYFNTLGNLLGDDRAALLFLDFERGDLLHLQGRVTVDWNHGRRLTLAVDRCWRRRQAVSLRWSAPEPSPFLDSTEDRP